jgi:hypothetical protein
MTSFEDGGVRPLWQIARLFLDAADPDSREIRAGVLLLAAATECGPHLRRLREFTGIPWTDITKVSYYLRQAGIWERETVYAPWLVEDSEPDLAVINFTLQVLVATGDVMYRGEDTYSVRMLGEAFGVDCAIPWRDVVPARPLRITSAEPAWLPPAQPGTG